MTIQVEICSQWSTEFAAVWADLSATRTVFQDLAWYQSTASAYQSRLLVAKDNGVPVALLPVFIFQETDHYYHTPFHILCGFREHTLFQSLGISTAVLEQAPSVPWFPCMVSMSPYGYRGGMITTLCDEQFDVVADAILAALDTLCKHIGICSVSHFFLNARSDAPWMNALRRHGLQLSRAGADCNIDLQGDGLDHYFRSLGSSRLRRLRAEKRKALADPDVTWRVFTRDNPPASKTLLLAAELFCHTARKHQDTYPPISLYLKVLFSWPGCWYLFIGEANNGQPRSALLAFVKDSVFYPKFVGSLEVRNDYLFLVYHCLLETAAQQHITRIEFGGGSHQAKLLRGASLRWLMIATYAYHPQLAAYLQRFLPQYEAAKSTYFSQLVARYQVDHPVHF